MTTRTQLGYESQKVLMKFLDPNSRTFLFHKCPALRTINKMTPIKIDTLSFTLDTVFVNGVSYEIQRRRVRRTRAKNEASFELIIRRPNARHRSLEWVKSSRSLEEGINYLFKRVVIWNHLQVKNIEIIRTRELILPFPPESLKIEKISVKGDAIRYLKKLRPMIVGEVGVLEAEMANHPDLEPLGIAKELHISKFSQLRMVDLLKVSNSKVVWETDCLEFIAIPLFINDWKLNPHPHDRNYSLKYVGFNHDLINYLMNSVGKIAGAVKTVFEEFGIQRHSYTFPLNNYKELNVFVRFDEDTDEKGVKRLDHFLNFLINQKGIATPFEWTCRPF